MELRVVKRSEDSEKDRFIVVLKGKDHKILENFLVEVELKLSSKVDDIMDIFPMSIPVLVEIEMAKEEG